jgi:hypothetical protein
MALPTSYSTKGLGVSTPRRRTPGLEGSRHSPEGLDPFLGSPDQFTTNE